MSRSLPLRIAAPTLLLSALLVGCGSDEAEDEPDDAAAGDTAAPDEAAGTDAGTEPEQPDAADDTENGTEDGSDDGASPVVDTSVPPAPDPDASADDFPGYEWAFDRGHSAGLYGREDYYEPSSVSEAGSFEGLSAEEAYHAGFARGLADAQARADERQAEADADEELAQESYPLGEVLEGWDPRMAVAEFWELGDAPGCDEADAGRTCLDTWYTSGNSEIVALARLDPGSGGEPDHALLLTGTVSGYEVLDHWAASDEPPQPLPDWAERAS